MLGFVKTFIMTYLAYLALHYTVSYTGLMFATERTLILFSTKFDRLLYFFQHILITLVSQPCSTALPMPDGLVASHRCLRPL